MQVKRSYHVTEQELCNILSNAKECNIQICDLTGNSESGYDVVYLKEIIQKTFVVDYEIGGSPFSHTCVLLEENMDAAQDLFNEVKHVKYKDEYKVELIRIREVENYAFL